MNMLSIDDNLPILPIIASIREYLAPSTAATAAAAEPAHRSGGGGGDGSRSGAREIATRQTAREQQEQSRRLQQLLKKIAESNRNRSVPKCRKCLTNYSDCVLVPCGHLCACIECSAQLAPYCPDCYVSIDACVQVRRADLARWRAESCWICQRNLADTISLTCGHIYACGNCLARSSSLASAAFCLICNNATRRTVTIIPSENENCAQHFNNPISQNNQLPSSSENSPSTSEHSSIKCCELCKTPKNHAAFLPCGHTVSCAKCFANAKRCPVCNLKVTQVIRLYRNHSPNDGQQQKKCNLEKIASSLNNIYDRDAHECVICTESCERIAAFLPCGHSDVCVSCAREIRVTSGNFCPICRTRIEKSVEI